MKLQKSTIEVLKKKCKYYNDENDFCEKIVHDMRYVNIIFPECKYEENNGYFSYALEEKFRQEVFYPLLKQVYIEWKKELFA